VTQTHLITIEFLFSNQSYWRWPLVKTCRWP